MKKGTIRLTITLRGEPVAVGHALANGLPSDVLKEIRDGMVREIEKRSKRPTKGTRRVTIKGKAGK